MIRSTLSGLQRQEQISCLIVQCSKLNTVNHKRLFPENVRVAPAAAVWFEWQKDVLHADHWILLGTILFLVLNGRWSLNSNGSEVVCFNWFVGMITNNRRVAPNCVENSNKWTKKHVDRSIIDLKLHSKNALAWDTSSTTIASWL